MLKVWHHDTQHNDSKALCIKGSFVTLSITLCWVPLRWVSRHQKFL